MKPPENNRIILIGFSTTGKSTIGRQVAGMLGWSFQDTDDEIVALAGKSIPAIFAEDGEERFRDWETEALRRTCGQGQTVIATGGGVVLRETNRQLMHQAGFVVCLEARPETILRRSQADAAKEANPVVRPLLAGEEPLARIRYLKEFRQAFYAIGDWTVHTDNLTADEVATEILHGWTYAVAASAQSNTGGTGESSDLPPILAGKEARESEAPYCEENGASFVIETPGTGARYPVFIEWGGLNSLGRRIRNAGLGSAAHVVADASVAELYWPRIQLALRDAGVEADCFSFVAGETAKSFATAERIFDWLLDRRAERGQPVVAVGGGVAGDLAGFVAATYQRGMPLVQVPTTMLAMVDSSLGGKVAVNLPRAKNMVGAFHQPKLVLADVSTLASLPKRELTSGWAETIKHGFIADPDLLMMLEKHGPTDLLVQPALLTEVIRRSAAVKAKVVTEDPKETGRRIILNYGHTLGHALETSQNYAGLLHGEAVAVGMMASAWIAHKLGLVSDKMVERHERVLSQFGLPTRFPQANASILREAISHDKKVKSRAVRWVLLSGIGQTTLRDDVPASVVDEAIVKITGK